MSPSDEKPTQTSGVPPEESTKAMWRKASQFSYVGIFFGVAVVLGWLGGTWLEKRFGGKPWVSLGGVLLGVTAGFRELYRIAKSVQRESHE